jgi:hypothetical protein
VSVTNDPAVVGATAARARLPGADDVTLVDLLDRILATGVIIKGDVVLSVAGIDLVHLGLQLSLTAVGGPDDPT